MTGPVGVSGVETSPAGLGSASAAAARVAELQSLLTQVETGTAADAGNFGEQLAEATAVSGQAPAVGNASAATAPISSTGSALNPAVPFANEINAAAARHGLDPALLAGLIKAESSFDPNVGSAAGAQGLAALMPETAASVGVKDPHNPVESIEGGAQVLREMLDKFGGDTELALAAYNAGPGAVEQYGGIPPYSETQTYVPRVLGFAEEFRHGATGDHGLPATTNRAAAGGSLAGSAAGHATATGTGGDALRGPPLTNFQRPDRTCGRRHQRPRDGEHDRRARCRGGGRGERDAGPVAPDPTGRPRPRAGDSAGARLLRRTSPAPSSPTAASRRRDLMVRRGRARTERPLNAELAPAVMGQVGAGGCRRTGANGRGRRGHCAAGAEPRPHPSRRRRAPDRGVADDPPELAPRGGSAAPGDPAGSAAPAPGGPGRASPPADGSAGRRAHRRAAAARPLPPTAQPLIQLHDPAVAQPTGASHPDGAGRRPGARHQRLHPILRRPRQRG